MRSNHLSTIKLAHISSGFLAVLVGYASSVAIILQAAHAAAATPTQLNSWMWALGVGMAISCFLPSWFFKAPILTAWSTPGAALLATSLQGISMNEAIAAFLFASTLMTIIGSTSWFEKFMRWVPRPIASAMLAGILINFGLGLFDALSEQLAMAGLMLGVFLIARHSFARYAVIVSLFAGVLYAYFTQQLNVEHISWQLTWPTYIAPHFDWRIMLGVGIPLCLVTLSSQNIPGLAVLRANGYQTPAKPLIAGTGILGIVLAPFGGFAFNLAAITAALCASPDTDPDPKQRYKAAMWAGFFYLCTGVFGTAIVGLFTTLPHALIAAIAGIALLGTIAASLVTALEEPAARDAAVLTFLCTASGMSFMGIGSAFWGVLLGLALVHLPRLLNKKKS